MLVCALQRLATQRQRPQSQHTHIPAPGKIARTKRQLQSSKSQLKMSLEHNKDIYCWFHQRTAEREQRTPATWHYISLTLIWKTLPHNKVLSSSSFLNVPELSKAFLNFQGPELPKASENVTTVILPFGKAAIFRFQVLGVQDSRWLRRFHRLRQFRLLFTVSAALHGPCDD